MRIHRPDGSPYTKPSIAKRKCRNRAAGKRQRRARVIARGGTPIARMPR